MLGCFQHICLISICQKRYARLSCSTKSKNAPMATLVFFILDFTVRQDYFTHFEPSQSVGGAKTGGLREKTPDHQHAELGLSPS